LELISDGSSNQNKQSYELNNDNILGSAVINQSPIKIDNVPSSLLVKKFKKKLQIGT
jgi:hypothetical protein